MFTPGREAGGSGQEVRQAEELRLSPRSLPLIQNLLLPALVLFSASCGYQSSLKPAGGHSPGAALSPPGAGAGGAGEGGGQKSYLQVQTWVLMGLEKGTSELR